MNRRQFLSLLGCAPFAALPVSALPMGIAEMSLAAHTGCVGAITLNALSAPREDPTKLILDIVTRGMARGAFDPVRA